MGASAFVGSDVYAALRQASTITGASASWAQTYTQLSGKRALSHLPRMSARNVWSFARLRRNRTDMNDAGRETEFPDMPCMKRVYRDKKGVVPLVGSQKQRALLVPLINRG